MSRPTVVPVTSLADAASVGVDLALQERANATTSGSTLPPGTTGIWQDPSTTEPVVS
ncbi:MAG TPA: hypothetical protein VF092_08235 [Longimicrobium sp.]